jgi:hypothetical protein
MAQEEGGRRAPVWARNGVTAMSCPKSLITAESESLVEEFWVRRSLKSWNFEGLSARQVEAFQVLAEALAAEAKHGE